MIAAFAENSKTNEVIFEEYKALLDASKIAVLALTELSPCQATECKQTQTEWLEVALKKLQKAIETIELRNKNEN